jgi:hypothetical protein
MGERRGKLEKSTRKNNSAQVGGPFENQLRMEFGLSLDL